MNEWQQRLADKQASINSLIKTAQSFKSSFGSLLSKYSGGMPANLLAAIAALESGGKMVAGDSSLGEFGFFQVAAHTEKEFQVPTGLRTSPEGNIFLGSLEYNVEAARLLMKYPQYLRPYTLDLWLIARMVFVFGRSGTDTILKHSLPNASPGRVFDAVVRWADATGAVPIGSSPAGKIWFRIKAIEKLTVPVAKALGAVTPGAPQAVSAPLGVRYVLPSNIKLNPPSAGGSLILIAVAGLAFLYLKFRV